MNLLIRIWICIFFAGLMLYRYIDKLNELTELRLSVPAVKRELREIQEKNLNLQFEIEQFESPIHLMELARKPEFSHLKYVSEDQILVLPLNEKEPLKTPSHAAAPL